MSYEPTTWATGDTVTAEKLNNMEGGIVAASPFYVNVTYAEGTGYSTSVASGEIAQALSRGQMPTAAVSGYPNSMFGNLILPLTDCSDSGVYLFCGTVTDATNHTILPTLVVVDLEGHVSVSMLEDGTAPFFIYLTPTAADYSGTMDKTPEEIHLAFSKGQRIRGVVYGMDAQFDFTQFAQESNGQSSVFTCHGLITYNSGGQWMNILISTSPSDQTYSTVIFPLSAM